MKTHYPPSADVRGEAHSSGNWCFPLSAAQCLTSHVCGSERWDTSASIRLFSLEQHYQVFIDTTAAYTKKRFIIYSFFGGDKWAFNVKKKKNRTKHTIFIIYTGIRGSHTQLGNLSCWIDASRSKVCRGENLQHGQQPLSLALFSENKCACSDCKRQHRPPPVFQPETLS